MSLMSRFFSPFHTLLLAFRYALRTTLFALIYLFSIDAHLGALVSILQPAPDVGFFGGSRSPSVEDDLSIVHGATNTCVAGNICDFLDIQGASVPTGIAIEDIHGHQLTYAELQSGSVILARQLQTLGVRRGVRVCLLLERSVAQIVTIFAVLRLGAAYIPLDGASIPDSTLTSVLIDSQPALVLVSEAHVSRLTSVAFPWHCIEQLLRSNLHKEPILLSFNDAQTRDPAYIIYTSGTTGKPKGVIVNHASVVNLVCQQPGNLNISQSTKVAQLLNVAFDMCAWEIFGCILNGGSLHLRGRHRPDWLKVMATVDVIICTPSVLDPHDPASFPNIKTVAVAGEPCSSALANRWTRNGVQFYNCCGPTEVTIVNTMDLHRFGGDVTIGRPTPNNSVYVLDDKLRPLPCGEVGVMWGGGAGVSAGYLNLPEQTLVKFRPDPFRPGGVMYNTGDLGRLRDDGRLDHMGRVDDQVKVKGFRVELDGVSAAMRTCCGVLCACALLVGSELYGFYAPETVSPMDVRDSTARLQPYYAVPTRFVALRSLPLTSNGKIDKRKLRELASSMSESGQVYSC